MRRACVCPCGSRHGARRKRWSHALDLGALADMNITIVEGCIILDKGRAEKGALPRQVLMLRDLVKTLFAPA